MKVLIAADERLFRRILRDALAPQGYAIVELADGAEALRVLEAEGWRGRWDGGTVRSLREIVDGGRPAATR